MVLSEPLLQYHLHVNMGIFVVRVWYICMRTLLHTGPYSLLTVHKSLVSIYSSNLIKLIYASSRVVASHHPVARQNQLIRIVTAVRPRQPGFWFKSISIYSKLKDQTPLYLKLQVRQIFSTQFVRIWLLPRSCSSTRL